MVETSYSDASVKIPPHDLDAEEAVLGSFLIDVEAISQVSNLQPHDFYREKHRWVFEACISLFRRDEPTNQILVAHELARRQQLEAAGGSAFISHLVSSTPTSSHVVHYANIVKRLSFARKLISIADQIAAIGYEQPIDIDTAFGRAIDLLNNINGGNPGKQTTVKGAIDLKSVRKD